MKQWLIAAGAEVFICTILALSVCTRRAALSLHLNRALGALLPTTRQSIAKCLHWRFGCSASSWRIAPRAAAFRFTLEDMFCMHRYLILSAALEWTSRFRNWA